MICVEDVFVVFLLLTGFVCLVHISDVIFDANQSREYKCSLFSSEISRSCLHWRHHLLFPFLASPNLCGSRCSSIDSFKIIISCSKFRYYSFPHNFFMYLCTSYATLLSMHTMAFPVMEFQD